MLEGFTIIYFSEISEFLTDVINIQIEDSNHINLNLIEIILTYTFSIESEYKKEN